MTPQLVCRRAGQDYEFIVAGEVVACLVWIAQSQPENQPGWVLRVPGWPDRQMYRVPQALVDDLAAARRYREAATVGLALAIVDERLSGLVPKP